MQKNTVSKMKKNIKINRLLILIAVSVFFFIFPWTKEVKIFSAKDVNWEILKSVKKVEKFDSKSFAFSPQFQLNDEILKLNGQKISIKGFFKKEIHHNHSDFIITETVTDVCFMCDHDEHYNLIKLIPETNEKQFFNSLKNDTLIQVSGIFELNQEPNAHSIFLLKDARSENFLNLKK